MLYNISMKKVYLASTIFLLFPLVTHAQNLLLLVVNFVKFINGVLIPFLLGIGFLMFVVNVVRYFVLGSANEEGRDKAKSLAIYSVAAFVLIVTFWGIINLLAGSLDIRSNQPVSDYVCKDGGPGCQDLIDSPCQTSPSQDCEDNQNTG